MVNPLELDQMLRALTEYEQSILKNKSGMLTQELNYTLLKKINEKEYLVPTPADFITIYKQPRFLHIPRHKHDVLELVYMYSGQSTHMINDKRFVLSKGEVCILDTNVVHSVEAAGEDDILINVLMNTKYFDAALLSSLSSHEALSNFLVRAIYQSKEYNDYIIFHSNENLNIHGLMANLMRENYDRKLGSEEAMKCYIKLIFLELLRIYEIQTTEKKLPQKMIVTDILKYIDSNYQDVTLLSLAERYNFHPNYLSSFLKKMAGKNFKEIVQEKKLNHAIMLLMNTDMDIESISKDCGFTNLSFFYKKFYAAFRSTPKEYRNSNLDKYSLKHR